MKEQENTISVIDRDFLIDKKFVDLCFFFFEGMVARKMEQGNR